MLNDHIPARIKQFLATEAGLFSLQLVLFVPLVGIGATVVLPNL